MMCQSCALDVTERSTYELVTAQEFDFEENLKYLFQETFLLRVTERNLQDSTPA